MMLTDSTRLLQLLRDMDFLLPPDIITWRRLDFADAIIGLEVTIAGMPDWSYVVPVPEPGAASQTIHRGSVNRTWWCRNRFAGVPMTQVDVERSLDVLPQLAANGLLGAVPPLTDVLQYMRTGTAEGWAYDDLAEAEAGGFETTVYRRTTVPTGGGDPSEIPYWRFSIGLSPVQIEGTNVADVMLMAWVGSEPEQVQPEDRWGPLGDRHVFVCRMTGTYTFAGAEIGGSASLTGRYVYVG